jgi:flagellar hook-length control protein FliK
LIQLSASAAPQAPAAPRPAPVTAAGTGGFAVALAAAAVPEAAEKTVEALIPDRQALAAGGKKLPGLDDKPGEGEGDTDPDTDSDADVPDASFAWFAAPVVSDPARTGFSQAGKPAPRPITLGSSPDGNTPGAAKPALDTAAPQVAGKAPDAITLAGDAAADPAARPVPQPAAAPTVGIALPAAADPKPVFQPRADAAQPAPPQQPVALPTVEATLEVPALLGRPVAMSAPFSLDTPGAPRRLIREIAGATFAPTAPDAASAPAIAAPGDLQQAMLDTRRHEWMGSMIDRIEAMRDASAIGDTRIRLSPAALGQVDISIRQEGDRVHVHFAAETQAGRQLLTDAQPRLAELAEARGVKLGQTSVDSGTSGSGQQQSAATPGQPVPLRPAGAVAAEAAPDTDQRIA